MNNNPFNENNIRDKREMNKVSLSSYAFSARNNFDYPADQLIEKLEKENKEILDAHDQINELYENEREKFNSLADQTGKSYHELLNQVNDNLKSVSEADEEIFIFLQLKIIYAAKHLEVNIRTLVKAAYPDAPVERFFNWQSVKDFLETKGIGITQLTGYREVNQLRTVNNHFKHSDDPDELSKKGIPEFPDRQSGNRWDLKGFYERVKDFPNRFLDALSGAIYTEQYEFNDEKINDIAKSLALRMDKKVADKFIVFFQGFYNS